MRENPKWHRYLHFWSRVERDVDAELRFHLEARIEALMGQGLSPDEARERARSEFGDVEAVRERLTAIDRRLHQRRARAAWWEGALQDGRYAVRSLRRNPVLAFTIITTVALGVGAATAMYGVMRTLLLQPPPFVNQPQQVVKLYRQVEGPDLPRRGVSAWPFMFLEQLQRDSAGVAVAGYASRSVPVGEGVQARMTAATYASAGFWSVLGVRPAVGRWPSAAESHPASGARVVVLGHAYWRRMFNADPNAIGRLIRVKGFPYEVIGVAPRGFRGVDLADVDLWLPLSAWEEGEDRHAYWHTMPTSGDLHLVARLTTPLPGDRRHPELTRRWEIYQREAIDPIHGTSPEIRRHVVAGPTTGALGSDMERIPEGTVALWLSATGIVLLAVACANVAGMLLLRGLRRRREIQVRMALGMSRRRLAALLLLESSLLVLAGGVAGVVAAIWGGAAVQALLIPDLTWDTTRALDWRFVMLTAALVAGTAVVAGLVPATDADRSIASGLRDGAEQGGSRRSRARPALLTTQCALSVVLLVASGLFVRSLRALQTTDLGLEPDRVLSIEAEFAGTGWTETRIAAFYERALASVRALPGVEHASLSHHIPLRSASGGSIRLTVDGERLRAEGGAAPVYNSVTSGFLATTGLRILEGRDFVESERRTGQAVLVDQTMVRQYWGGRSPVGTCVYLANRTECARVVGVVENARLFEIREEEVRPTYYRPLPVEPGIGRALLVRPAPGLRGAERMITAALGDLVPSLPFLDVRRLDAVLEPQKRPWRLGAMVFTLFGATAMLLAAVGLWASIAYGVDQRAREFGVRLAVGAQGRDVMALVLRDGLRIGLGGVSLGLGLMAVVSPRFADLLYRVSPRDPLVFGVVAAVALAVAVVAGVLPSRRAARIEPVRVLRAD